MPITDTINGLFELFGGLMILLSVWKLEQDKAVKGVSYLHVGFFTLWGIWNLVWYPSIGQWVSFVGGVLLVAANTCYLWRLVRWSRGV